MRLLVVAIYFMHTYVCLFFLFLLYILYIFYYYFTINNCEMFGHRWYAVFSSSQLFCIIRCGVCVCVCVPPFPFLIIVCVWWCRMIVNSVCVCVRVFLHILYLFVIVKITQKNHIPQTYTRKPNKNKMKQKRKIKQTEYKRWRGRYIPYMHTLCVLIVICFVFIH